MNVKVVGLPNITEIAQVVPVCFQDREYAAQTVTFAEELAKWLQSRDEKLVIVIPALYAALAAACIGLVQDAREMSQIPTDNTKGVN